MTQLWHAAGIIEASFQSSHDWRGRPRMVTGSSGAVSADHGRCSDMGALDGSLCLQLSMARRTHQCCRDTMLSFPALQNNAFFIYVGIKPCGTVIS